MRPASDRSWLVRGVLAAVVAAAGAGACTRREGPPAASTPLAPSSSSSSSSSSLTEGACVSCHPAEVEEWQGSMHHASFTSADFQRSYRAEPRDYCADCHAPQRLGDGARDGASGIGCASCHAVAEGHLARVVAERPHVTTRECRSCHDFDVPGTQSILQSTAREQATTSFATTKCEACHMAAAAPARRDHRFGVSRDPALLGRALAVSPARIDAAGVVVQLATRGVGHRFPTGDLYRRLTISLTAYDDRGALIAGDTFHLGRDWDAHRASLGSHLPEAVGIDSRLSETARDFRIACARSPARVHLTATYERGASADGASFEAFEATEILDTDLATTPGP